MVLREHGDRGQSHVLAAEATESKQVLAELALRAGPVLEEALHFRHGTVTYQHGVARQAWFEKAGESDLRWATELAARSSLNVVQELAAMMLFNGVGTAPSPESALAKYMSLAEDDCPGAMREIGLAYRDGAGVTQDSLMALSWLTRAGEAGDSEACMSVMSIHLAGLGVPIDKQSALHWARRAADLGHPDGISSLATFYFHGEGVEEDLGEYYRLLRIAAPRGGPSARCMLAEALAYGWGKEKNEGEALTWAMMAAVSGDPVAQMLMAELVGNAIADEGDHSVAIRWLRRSADQGHAPAEFNLAEICERGAIVEEDPNEALKWYLRAAEHGHVEAMFRAGRSLYHGFSGQRDWVQSYERLHRAAVEGHAEAQYSIGTMLLSGRSAEEDFNAAVMWLRRAAEQSLEECRSKALGLLAHCYDEGLGVDEDWEEALRLYEASIELGGTFAMVRLAERILEDSAPGLDKHRAILLLQQATEAEPDYADAWFQLAECYRMGQGVMRDLSKARDCLVEALNCGHRDAEALLAALETETENDGN